MMRTSEASLAHLPPISSMIQLRFQDDTESNMGVLATWEFSVCPQVSRSALLFCRLLAISAVHCFGIGLTRAGR
jgi:hypothetical protein